jgi:8-oxo-dGTP pyrophosphatase MutT (NUDIX family)
MRPPGPEASYRKAAVLLLIYPRTGEDYIIFTRRTDTVEHHKGQISLPGGGQDPDDAGAVDTALRETHEELGLDPQAVEVVGTLRDFYVRVSGFVVTPVVARLKPGIASADGLFNPNPEEVAEIIEVPLSALRDDAIHRTEARVYEGVTYHVHYYTYGPYEIWGATARIIYEYLNSGQPSARAEKLTADG